MKPTRREKARAGPGLAAFWPELLVSAVALALRLSFDLRLRHSILDGNLVSDELTYWFWSEHILRAGPVGPHPFFMGPLYPYAVALLRLAFGIREPFGVLLVQALLGSVACAVLTNAARRLTSAPVAVVSGLLAAAYTTAIVHDGRLLAESLLFFLAACLVRLAIVAVERACTLRHALLLGALVGLLAQGRALFVLLLPALAPVLRTAAPGRRASRVIVAVAAFALVCVPAAWHNAAVSGSFIPFTYNLGMNLAIGNHSGASGTYEDITPIERPDAATADPQGGGNFDGRAQLEAELGRPVSPAESSREWTLRALRFWRDEPIAAASLTARKLAMVVNRREYPQLENMQLFGALLGFIGVVPFWLLAGLAFPSLFTRWRDPVRIFLGISVAVLVAGTALFFVVDRYRFHMVPWLVPLVALTIAGVVERVRARSLRPKHLVPFAVSAAILLLPVPHATRAQEDWALAAELGDSWAVKGHSEAALQSYSKAEDVVRSGALLAGSTATGRGKVVRFEGEVAGVALAAGDTARAIEAWRLAAGVAPDSLAPRREIALLLALQGRANDVPPGATAADLSMEALTRAADALANGDTTASARWMDAAIRLDPAAIAPREARIRLAIDSGRLGPAGELLRTDAAVLGLASTRTLEALLAWQAGDRAGARRLVSEVPASAALTPPTRLMLEWLRSQVGPAVRPGALRAPPESR